VEIGSGSGAFLQVLRDRGYTNFAGFEMNASAILECEKQNLPVAPQDLFSREKEIDALFIFDVIEHVTKPEDFLDSIRQRLKQGGLLVVATSCNQRIASRILGRFWWFLIPPNHTIIYNTKSLKHLLTRMGYRVIRSFQINYEWLSFNNGIAKVWNRFPLFRLRDNKLLHWTRNLVLPFFHFTSFLMIAQKEEL